MNVKNYRSYGNLPEGAGRRVAIVSSRFYPELADQLEASARAALGDCGVQPTHIFLFRVPGCFELPVAAARAIKFSLSDAVVALGVVVRGETPHFEYVAGECARGLMTVSVDTSIPVGFGVLTTNTMEQAQQRADPALGNKGYEAAIAALTAADIR